MRRQAPVGNDGRRLHRLRLFRALALAGFAGALLLGSGCAATNPLDWIRNGFKVGPNYCRPPAPVAEQWIDASDPRVQSRHLQFGDWWSVFQDPALNGLIRTAYAQNLNLRVIGTRVLQARAQQAITVGNIFPQTQQASGGFSRVGLSQNTFNNPAAFAGLSPEPIPPGSLIGNFYSDSIAGFNMSWELDFWGRFRRNIESANAGLESSVENFDDALVTLLADVATNYVQYRVAQQRIKIARDNIKSQTTLVALAEAATESRHGDHARRRTAAGRSWNRRGPPSPALQIMQGEANDRLCILLGMPPHDLEPELGPGPELGSMPMPNTPDCVAAGIPADLLSRRPDVRSAERQVAAQSPQIGVAEADLYPTIFVNGTLG